MVGRGVDSVFFLFVTVCYEGTNQLFGWRRFRRGTPFDGMGHSTLSRKHVF